MRQWLFRILFRREYEHMRELVDDVIRLEAEKNITITSGSTSKTEYLKEKVQG